MVDISSTLIPGVKMKFDHRLDRAIRAYVKAAARNVTIVNGEWTKDQQRRVDSILKQAERVKNNLK